MKNTLTIIGLLLMTSPVVAQFGPPIYTPGLLTTRPADVECADIDGDGDPDMIVSQPVGGVLRWHPNDGTGYLEGWTTIAVSLVDYFWGIAVGDIDGDGDNDVVASSDDRFVGSLNNGTGTFGPLFDITTGINNGKDAALVDVDNDGDLDLVGGCGGGLLFWSPNNGNGTFQARISINNSAACNSVKVADVDGDTDPDIVVGGGTATGLRWYRNLGGTFSTANIISSGSLTYDVEVADMDGDLDLDVVFEQQNVVQWWANDGNGVFTLGSTAPGSYLVQAMDLVDVDNDGDNDVVAGGFSGTADWRWWPNTGGILGTAIVMSTAFNYPIGSVACDLNGDGDRDVIALDWDNHDAHVFENRSIEMPEVNLQVRIALEGPYDPNTQTMRDDLRGAGLIPLTEPYTALGYSFIGGGGESVAPAVLAITGNQAIVDWMVVELRSAADSSVVLYSRCGLLRRDCRITDLDGTSSLNIPMPAGNYFIAVRHRNHLGCMSQSPLYAANLTTVVHFFWGLTPVHGVEGLKAIATRNVMWTGDASSNGVLKYVGTGNDRDAILGAIGGLNPLATLVNVYRTEDVNMDGIVRYVGANNDRDPILVNIGGLNPANTRTQQLP